MVGAALGYGSMSTNGDVFPILAVLVPGRRHPAAHVCPPEEAHQ
jgi:hypothetical protein